MIDDPYYRNHTTEKEMEFFNNGTRLGFAFPDGVTEDQDILFPAFDAQTPDYAATVAATINAPNTLIAPAQLTGNLTLNLTLSAKLKGGERLAMKIESDGSARTVTLGTGITGPALTTTANKTHCAEFVFDGTGYVQVSPWVQID